MPAKKATASSAEPKKAPAKARKKAPAAKRAAKKKAAATVGPDDATATEGADPAQTPSPPSPPRPPRPPRPERPVGLAQRLATMDDEALCRLLRARPDALHPPRARSFERLASALGSPHSILAALRDADQLLVGITVALMYVGGAPSPGDLLAVLPEDLPLDVLEATLDGLEDLALLQRTADRRVHPVSGLAQVVQMPKGFGPPVRNLLSTLQNGHLLFLYDRIVTELGVERTLLRTAPKQVLIDGLVGLLTDPDRVVALVGAGPPGTDDLVARLAARGPSIEIRDLPPMRVDLPHRGMLDPRWWCVEHGLVIMASWGLGMMPREVAAAIRGGRPLDTVRWTAPDVHTEALPEHHSLGEVAGHAAASLLERVGRLVGDLEHEPLPALKTGGVGARALKPLGKALGIDEQEAAFLVDLAGSAGLLTPIRMLDPALDELSPAERKRRLRHYATSEIAVIVPTEQFDRWRRLSPAARWTHLVDAWFTTRRWIELAGRRDAEDKLIPAFDMTARHGDGPTMRRAVLDALLQLPRGERPTDDSFIERLEWQQSMVWSQAPAGLVDTARCIGESLQVLGLAVSGALSPLGAVFAESLGDAPDAATLADRRRALIDVAAGVLPALTSRFTLQADLTAMAAGPLAPEVISGLTALADVESRGAASVFRFTEASLRSAFDAGRSAEDILAFLEEHADRGVPQPLRYLVTDTERRHGSMRVGAAKSYVRSEDPAAMAELVKARKVAKLELRLLAPTVAVCDQPIAKVLTALRAAGFLPAQEDADGALVTTRPSMALRQPTRPGMAVPRAMAYVGADGYGRDDLDELDHLGGLDDVDDLGELVDLRDLDRVGGPGPNARDAAAPGGAGDAVTTSTRPADELVELAAIGAAFSDRLRTEDPHDLEQVVATLREEAAARPSPVERAAPGAHQPGRVPPDVIGRLSSVFNEVEVVDARELREQDEALQDAREWLERQQRRGR